MSRCQKCGDRMPPLNGVEENDFSVICADCYRNPPCWCGSRFCQGGSEDEAENDYAQEHQA